MRRRERFNRIGQTRSDGHIQPVRSHEALHELVNRVTSILACKRIRQLRGVLIEAFSKLDVSATLAQ